MDLDRIKTLEELEMVEKELKNELEKKRTELQDVQEHLDGKTKKIKDALSKVEPFEMNLKVRVTPKPCYTYSEYDCSIEEIFEFGTDLLEYDGQQRKLVESQLSEFFHGLCSNRFKLLAPGQRPILKNIAESYKKLLEQGYKRSKILKSLGVPDNDD